MSKFGKSSAVGGGGVVLNDIKPLHQQVTSTTTSRVTRATTALAAKQQQLQQQQQQKSIVSIEVNMIEAATAGAAAAAAVPIMKKKRAALGNISNAASIVGTGVEQQLVAAANIAAVAAAATTTATGGGMKTAGDMVKEVAKKYRLGAANIANVIPSFGGAALKKVDVTAAGSQLPRKTSSKASSKENLNLNVPSRKTTAAVTTTKKPTVSATSTHAVVTSLSRTTSVSKSENDIVKKVVTGGSVVESSVKTVDVVTSSSSTSLITTTTSSEATAAAAATTTLPIVRQQQRRADQVEGWEDIDCADVYDEFACGDYATAIFRYYRDRERSFIVRDYLSVLQPLHHNHNQPTTTSITRQMRYLLIDWMVEVQQQLEFNHEVLYLSVKLIDMFLTRQLVEKEQLQLLAAAAMLVACKFEERMPPVIEDFIVVSDNAYERKDMIRMEMDILRTVHFDLGAPLSYTFLRRYAKCIRADMKFLTLARYILELSLQDYVFAPERDSLKACAALFLAMRMAVAYESSFNIKPGNMSSEQLAQLYVNTAYLTSTEWNATLIHYTNAFVHDFVHLLAPMNNLVRNAPSSKYRTIYKKYSHPVFFEVAKVPALSDYQIDFYVGRNSNH